MAGGEEIIMKKSLKIAAASLFLTLIGINSVLAQQTGTGTGGSTTTTGSGTGGATGGTVGFGSGLGAGLGPYTGTRTSFPFLIGKILTWVFGAAGVIFVVLFVIGGIMYLTSAGNEEAATKAKKLLIDAVIGMIIIVSAWAAADWILKGIGGSANFY